MSENKTRPRHLYDTGVFRTLPPELRRRPKGFEENPHVAADSSKTDMWPTNPIVKPRPATPPMDEAEREEIRRDASEVVKIAAIVVAFLAVVAALALGADWLTDHGPWGAR